MVPGQPIVTFFAEKIPTKMVGANKGGCHLIAGVCAIIKDIHSDQFQERNDKLRFFTGFTEGNRHTISLIVMLLCAGIFLPVRQFVPEEYVPGSLVSSTLISSDFLPEMVTQEKGIIVPLALV